MKLYKTRQGIVIGKEEKYYLLKDQDWDQFINSDNLYQKAEKFTNSLAPVTDAARLIAGELLPPVGNQELWACGVTYLRSKIGRQEESKDAGGGDFYARVYEAE